MHVDVICNTVGNSVGAALADDAIQSDSIKLEILCKCIVGAGLVLDKLDQRTGLDKLDHQRARRP